LDGAPQKWKSGSPGWPIGHLQIFSLRSSRLVLSAISGLGLAGTSRRGGAGGIGDCCSPGAWRRKPPGPIDRICGDGGGAGSEDGARSGALDRRRTRRQVQAVGLADDRVLGDAEALADL
jgi:hypothetical protein